MLLISETCLFRYFYCGIFQLKKNFFRKQLTWDSWGELQEQYIWISRMFLRCYNTFKFADFLEVLDLFLSKSNVSGTRIFNFFREVT